MRAAGRATATTPKFLFSAPFHTYFLSSVTTHPSRQNKPISKPLPEAELLKLTLNSWFQTILLPQPHNYVEPQARAVQLHSVFTLNCYLFYRCQKAHTVLHIQAM